MEKVKFYFDPRCPWCYQTSRWAQRLVDIGELDVDWAVFSLEVVNLEEGKDPQELDAASGPALRTAILIHDKEGRKEIGRFYTALGKRIWESAPPATDMVQAVRESLEEAGFDPSLVDQAMSDPSTWDAVLAEHNQLIDEKKGFGVPTIALDGGAGPAAFGPVISVLPDDETAVELWKHVSWLLGYTNFAELKRNRLSQPDLAAIEWRRQQREREGQAAH